MIARSISLIILHWTGDRDENLRYANGTQSAPGKNVSGRKSINANSAIQTVLDDISLLVNEKQADIRVDKIGVILADKGHIMRVFQNLLQNSLKFVAPERHPVIEITVVDRTEEHITLAFKDNGIGFDNQYASRIFNLFERLHGKSEFEGTGMGLAICRKIVEKHNGSIWAEGRENNGSVFYMQLPVK